MRKLLLALLSLALSSSAGAQSCCDKNGFTNIAGDGYWYPAWPSTLSEASVLTTGANSVIDATGEKAAFSGFIINDDGASHVCSAAGGCTIGWRAGSVVTFANAGTSVDIGLQDLDFTGGPPADPDETMDVYGTLVGATDTISANTFYSTDMETGSKTVANATQYAVVIDMTARAGADSIRVAAAQGRQGQSPFMSLKTSGTWAPVTLSVPNVIITYDDGHKGWFLDSIQVASANETTNTFANNDEECNIVKFNSDVKVDAIKFRGLQAAGATAAANIYGNPLTSSPVALFTAVTIDDNAVRDNTTAGFYAVAIPETILMGERDYAVCIQSTTANNVTVWEYSINAAADMVAQSAGANVRLGTRSGGSGAFTEDTAKRNWISVKVSANKPIN